MQRNDRMALEIKDFGRKVVIKVNRGEVQLSKDKKQVTIVYEDAPIRGKKLAPKP